MSYLLGKLGDEDQRHKVVYSHNLLVCVVWFLFTELMFHTDTVIVQ